MHSDVLKEQGDNGQGGKRKQPENHTDDNLVLPKGDGCFCGFVQDGKIHQFGILKRLEKLPDRYKPPFGVSL
jgi:hypothetical protein